MDLNTCNGNINLAKTLYNNMSFLHKKLCPDLSELHNNNFDALNEAKAEKNTFVPQPK